MRAIAVAVLLSSCAASAAAAPDSRRTITLEHRIGYQQRIEQVLWAHRIWPKENPDPKPALSSVLSMADLRAKVESELKKSQALAQLWNRPLGTAALQAELNRMAASTRDPGLLRELLASVDDDPFVAAEMLARPILADRLLRAWFAADDRWHGALQRRAETERAAALDGEIDSQRTTVTWLAAAECPAADPAVICVDPPAWKARVDALRPGILQENETSFYAVKILESDSDRVRFVTVTWPKRSFDLWWSEQARSMRVDDTLPEIGTYTMPAVTGSPCVPETWTSMCCGVAPEGRSRLTPVWTGTEMIVWGGYTANYVAVNSGGRYRPATDSWTVMSGGPAVPSARAQYSAVWTGSQVLVWGGFGAARTNTGGLYDPATDAWTPTSTSGNVPTARFGHTAIWTGTRLVVWGGDDGSGTSGTVNTGGNYDPFTNTWQPTSLAGAPGARSHHAAVWTGSRMVVWGGTGTGNDDLKTGGRYDPVANTWQAIKSTGPTVPAGRANATAVWTGSTVIFWGGGLAVGTRLNSGGRYDPVNDSWSATSTANVPDARSLHTAVWTGSTMLVWGGSSITTYLDSGGRYDPAADSWTPITLSGAPSARSYQGGVWTGTEMIVWGGEQTNSTWLRSGGRYDPVSDSWVPTGTESSSVPPAGSASGALWTGNEMIFFRGTNVGYRYFPASDSWAPTSISGLGFGGPAVWTGSVIVIWGGDGSHSSGNRYNPVNNSWSSMTPFGSPPQRNSPSLVWTGTRALMWGGFTGGGVAVNTGGSYDPVSNSWFSFLADANTPQPRFAHSAVWTGTEMIVWGGTQSVTFFDTGGRYNPSTQSWTPVATAGNPGPRQGAPHRALWTGTRMIIWGGGVTTGGLYDPTSDSWTLISNSNAPSSGNGSAIWTGSEMVVWGGSASSTDPGTGAKYDPSSDSWTPTASSGAPMQRANHAGVWTGQEMIVWGGAGQPGLLQDGGRYCLASCDSPSSWYADADDDGYGVSSVSVYACAQPPGYAPAPGDCADGNPAVNPGAAEVCNGADDNCNQLIDDGVAPPAPTELTLVESGVTTQIVSSGPGASTFDVVTGPLSTLRLTHGNFAPATTGCLADNTAAPVNDASVPPVDDGWWYLSRGSNSCGGAGTYDSGSPSQTQGRDAEIAASPSACP